METKQEMETEEEKIYQENKELPIQDYEVPPPPPDDFVEAETIDHGYISDKEVKHELNQLKLSEPLANLIVSLMNIVLPALICNFTPGKDDDKNDILMDPTEKEAAIYAFSLYIKETNFNLSPGGILLTTIAGIYVPKFIYVFYTKRQMHIDTMHAMERKIQLLEQQNELLRNGAKTA